MKLEDWGETFTKEDFDNYRATVHAWDADDGLFAPAAERSPTHGHLVPSVPWADLLVCPLLDSPA